MAGCEVKDLTFAEAKAAKWSAGREKYGPEWQGDHPLLEALSDATDVAVYLDEAERRGVYVTDLQRDAELLWKAIMNRCRNVVTGFVLLMLCPVPAAASGPQCFPPCKHSHGTNCHEVQECVASILPPPRPCLDIPDERRPFYYACSKNDAPVDVDYTKSAFVCVAIPGEKIRHLRRTKSIAAIDAVVESRALNLTLCER